MKLQKSVVTVLGAGMLALSTLACEIEEEPGQELIPEDQEGGQDG